MGMGFSWENSGNTDQGLDTFSPNFGKVEIPRNVSFPLLVIGVTVFLTVAIVVKSKGRKR